MRSFDYFFVSAMLVGLSSLTTVFVSISYNTALAKTNTELIVNTLILLFVTELDEKAFEVISTVNPVWTERIIAETKHIALNRNGKGLLSKLRNFVCPRDLSSYKFPVDLDSLP